MMMRSLWAAVGLIWLSSHQAMAGTLDVASSDALADALRGAEPGTTIRLAPGDYGMLVLRDLAGGADAPIVIASADPSRPARFSRMILRDVAHIDLQDLLVDYTFDPSDPDHLRVLEIGGSQDLRLSGLVLDGDIARGVSAIADGYPTAYGIGIRNVDGLTLENSEIRGFFRGLVVGDSVGITVRGNDLHGMRMDGMNFAHVNQVLVEGNWVHDFKRSLASGDHADMIQFWTNGTEKPSTDVTIRGNLLASGAGAFTQSIFMRNEEVDRGRRSFADMAYRDVRIEDNVIINAHLHGITVGEADGLVVAGNAVLRNASSEGEDDNVDLWAPRIRLSPGSRDVTVVRNVTLAISGAEGQPDWRVEDNLLVQDRGPSGPGYYATVFAGMPAGDPRDPATFAPRAGGPLDGTGIGPTWLGQRRPR